MRRILGCLSAVLVTVAVAACASSSAGSAPPSPRLRALSYFPAASPFVMTLDTAPGSASSRQLKALERANPSDAMGLTLLYGRLGQLGIDYNRDVRPLFGNPVALGLSSPAGSAGSLLVAWVTRSATALHRIIATLHSLHPAGQAGGARLYASAHTAVAVDGATLIVGRTPAMLRAALTRSAEHQGINAGDYAAETSGVSSNGILEAFGNLTGVLSAPKAAAAQRVPWVAAIRSYGLSLSASGQAVSMHIAMNTSGRSLTPAQLPLASGSLGPSLVGPAPVEAGLRDPAQFLSFVIAAMRESSPRRYASFLRRTAALQRATGVDLATLESLLTGSLDVDSDGHAALVRADLSRPGVVARLLARLAGDRRAAGSAGIGRLTAVGGGFYSAQHGRRTTYVGVAAGRVVAGNAPLSAVRDFARAAANAPVQGGAVTAQVALGQLIALGLSHSPASSSLPPGIAQRLISAVGNLTATVQATTGGLAGSATIPFHAAALGGSGSQG